VGTLDDTGDVGHDERATVGQSHNAEVGLERGEGIVGNPGAGGGDDRKQRALPRVRLAHQSHIRDELEDQVKLPILSFLARLPLARGLVRSTGEVAVAPATAPASRHPKGVACADQLAQDLPGTGRLHYGAGWHGKVEVVS
jgi:hypothetical protein